MTTAPISVHVKDRAEGHSVIPLGVLLWKGAQWDAALGEGRFVLQSRVRDPRAGRCGLGRCGAAGAVPGTRSLAELAAAPHSEGFLSGVPSH